MNNIVNLSVSVLPEHHRKYFTLRYSITRESLELSSSADAVMFAKTSLALAKSQAI